MNHDSEDAGQRNTDSGKRQYRWSRRCADANQTVGLDLRAMHGTV